MSTATQSPPPGAPRYVDYDEFIDFQVQRTRTGIKSNDLLTALIGAAVGLLTYILVFAIFDHWVIEGGFSRGLRIALLLLLLAGLCVWFVWKLVIPYFRTVTALYAAKEIEQTEPSFRSTLLTLVDLKQAGREVSPEVRAVLEKRAGLGLTHMNVEQAVDRRWLMRLSYGLLALVVVTCLYAILSPKKLSNSLWRSLLPTASVAVDTRTRIDRVDPGTTDVLARSQLPVTVELSGVLPDEVTLHYSTADRRLVDEPISMRETGEGIRQYRGIITGENGRGILQSLTYYVVAGDARSDTFTVTVSQPPSATVDEVEYEFPQYMGFRNRVQVGGAIDAWEGTWVTVRGTANMPVKSAMVMFSDTDDLTQKAEEIPVDIENGTLLSARWQLRIRPDGTYPNFYRLQCRNDAGQTDPAPTLHPIKILPDQPPQIQLAHPTSDLERPANAIVPLLFAARDPDFLLRSVTLRLERNGESLPQSPRLLDSPPYRQSVTGTHDLELAPLNLQPGDRLTYWLEARDNMEPFADRSGNRTSTPRLNITIIEPAPPEEVRQQWEEDRQLVEERLEEAQQEPGGEQPQPTPAGDDDAAGTPPPPASESQDSSGEQADPSEGDQAQQAEGAQQEAPGEGGTAGESSQAAGQPQDGSGGTSDAGRQQQQAEGQQSGQSGNQSGGNEEAPFDDLLKELMQRERQQTPADESADQNARRQPQQGTPQNAADRSPSTDPAQTHNGSDPSAEQGTDDQPPAGADSPTAAGSRGEETGSTSPMGESKPSTGDTTDPTSTPGSPDVPQRGEGAEPSPDAANPNVRDGSTQGGQQSHDDPGAAPGGRPSAPVSDPEKARREPAEQPAGADPTSARKEGRSDAENQRPAPSGTESPGSPESRPTPAREGELPPPGSPQQQPSAPSESQSESGETPGQPTGQSPPGGPDGPPSAREGRSGRGSQKSGDPNAPQPTEEQSERPNGPSRTGEPQTPKSTGAEVNEKDSPAEDDRAAPADPSQQKSQPPPDGASPEGGNSADDGGTENGDRPQGSSPQGNEAEGGKPPEGGQPRGGEQNADGQQSSGDPSGQGSQAGGQQGGNQSGGNEGSGEQAGGRASGQKGSGGTPKGSSQANEGGGSGATGEQDPDAAPVKGQGGDAPSPAAAGDGKGEASGDIQGDDPDLEAKRKAANLVLKRLQEQLQRGEIDPQLREELGVTEEQMRRFTQKLQQRLADTGEDLSPEAEARRRQFEETLRNIDYGSTGTERAGEDGPREASGGFSGQRRSAPLNRRDATERYRERFSRQPRP